MKTNLSSANLARQQKTINQKYCFANYGIKSYLQLIEEGIIVRAKEELEPSVRFNRMKYFRMDNEQAKVYEQKLNTKVKVYHLYTADGSFFTCSKMVYDYFKEREKSLKPQFV